MSGVTSIETSLDDVDTRHPDLARLVGDGSVTVYGVNRALVAQRYNGGHVKVYARFRARRRTGTRTWTHVPGVTLLGDAAHLMPPLGRA